MSQNQPPGPYGGYPQQGQQPYPQQGQQQQYPQQGQQQYPQQGQQQYPQQGQQQYPQQGQQPYPQQGQQQYPQQGQQPYPQQGQFPQQGPVPPKKKGGGGLIIGILAVVVLLLGMGGFFYYSHFVKWGYTDVPSGMRAKIDPIIVDMDEAAEKVAKACADKSYKKNPLKGSKLLDVKGVQAIGVKCEGVDQAPFPPLDKVSDEQEITIRSISSDEFKCIPPNFLGTDEHDKTDCVMWKGSRFHYYVERVSGGARGTVWIEIE